MPKKILVADDSITIQKVMAITFAEGDYELHTVSNGTDAVVKARELRPDLVIADVVMPGKDGYEVCQEIKSGGMTAGIPVILLRGTFEAYDEAKAKAVGANGEIIKPFESDALLRKVEEVIEEASKAEEYLSAPPETLMPPSPTPPPPPPPPQPIAEPEPEAMDEEAVAITEAVEEPLDEPPPPESGTVALEDSGPDGGIVDDFASPANALEDNEPMAEEIIETVVDENEPGMRLPPPPPVTGLTEEVVPNFSADLRAPAYYDAEAAAAPEPEEISVEEPAQEMHAEEPMASETVEPIESAIEEVQEEVAAQPMPSQGNDTAVLEDIIEVESVHVEEPGFESEPLETPDEPIETEPAAEAYESVPPSPPVRDKTESILPVEEMPYPSTAESEDEDMPEPVLPPATEPVVEEEDEPMPVAANGTAADSADVADFNPLERFTSDDSGTPPSAEASEYGVYEETEVAPEEPAAEFDATGGSAREIEADIEGEGEPAPVELGNLSDDNDYSYGLVQKAESFASRASIEVDESTDDMPVTDDEELTSPIVEDDPATMAAAAMEEDSMVEAADWEGEAEPVQEPSFPVEEYAGPEHSPVIEEEADFPMTEAATEPPMEASAPAIEDDTDAVVQDLPVEEADEETVEETRESWQPEPEPESESASAAFPKLDFIAALPPPPPPPPPVTSAPAPLPTAASVPVAMPDEATLRIMIEDAVRRVVSELAASTIEKIAWEVVPELSEAIIRKELDDRLKLKQSGGG